MLEVLLSPEGILCPDYLMSPHIWGWDAQGLRGCAFLYLKKYQGAKAIYLLPEELKDGGQPPTTNLNYFTRTEY